MKNGDGGPVFPVEHRGPHHHDEGERDESRGLSLRDYFAAKAMEGIVADSLEGVHDDILARRAYEIADAMLAERLK